MSAPHIRPRYSVIPFGLGFVVLLAGLVVMPLPAGDTSGPKGLVTTLKGHAESIYSVAFSSDGKYVVTGSFDKTIKIWETATWKEVKSLGGPQGHQNLVLSIAVSPDGRSIASGSSDNTVKLWDFPSNSPIREFALGDAALGLGVSSDGKILTGAGKGGIVQIWNSADGKELFKLTGHTGPVTAAALSASGQWLASAGSDKTLRFWNPADGKALADFGASTAPINAIAFNPNNAALYSAGDDGLLRAWQLPPVGSRALPAHGDAVNSAVLSDDGKVVVTAGNDKTVRLANYDKGDNAKALSGPAAGVTSVAATSNAALVAGGTADGKLFLWNAADGKVIGQNKAHAGAVSGIAVNPQNSQLVTAGADGLMNVWAIPPVATRVLTHPDAVYATALRGDGKRLFTGGNDKILRSWNLENLQVERQFTGHSGPINAICANGDGSILASAGADATIRFWNQGNGQQTALLGAHAATITSLSLSPDGKQVLSGSEDGAVKLWSVPTTPPKLFAHPDQVTCAVLSPNGAKLLTGCTDKQVRLWDLANGKADHTLGGPTLAITSVTFSSDGGSFAGASLDKSITVWNAADGKEIKKLANLPASVQAISFSPDGKTLAGGLADGTVRIYDVGMAKETRSIPAHTGLVAAVAFSSKGDQIISGGVDKIVQVWNVADATNRGKFDQSSPVRGLVCSKDGAKVVVGCEDKSLQIWTLADGKKSASYSTPIDVRSVALNADASKILVGGGDGRATVYTIEGRQLESFQHDGAIVAAFFHPDNKQIVSASADKTARVWSSSLIWHGIQGGGARQAIFSPKGDRVFSSGDEKNIKIWNVADGKLLKTIAAHEGPLTFVALAVNSDGTRILTAGGDKTAKLWDATSDVKEGDKPLASFALAGPARSVAFSPNGTRVAIGVALEKEFPVQVFDAASSKELVTLAEQTGAVRSLRFMPDNRTVITASEDKNVRLADVGVLAVLEGHAGAVNSVAFHGGANQVLSGGADKTIRLWDLATGKMAKTFGPLADPVSSVAFSRDNSLVGAAGGKVVKVWNVADAKEVGTLVHPAQVLSLSFNGDKTRLATGAADNLTRVWDLATGKELQTFRLGGPIKSVVFHPDNVHVIAAADKGASVESISLTRLIKASDSSINGLAVVSGGSHILTVGADKAAKLWNLANGASERTFDVAGGPLKAIAVSKNSALVATGGAEGIVRVYNFGDAKLLGSYKAPGAIESLTFSPNNQALLGACADKSVVAWNVVWNPGQPLPPEFGKVVQSYSHSASATGVAFAPDGLTFYSSGLDKSIKTWKFASDNPSKTLAHPNLVDAVAFSPDGLRLATGCHDGSVRIWDLAKGQVVKEIKAHQITMPTPQPAAVYTLAWNNDGKQVVSGGYDGSMKLWDAANGTLVKEFKAYKEKDFEKGHREGVFSVAFSPDNKTIASCSSDHSIKLWNVADGMVAREFVDPGLKPGATPAPAHPGWVYALRFTQDGKHLLSIGSAPPNKGHLAIWSVADAKLLYTEDQAVGTYYALAISPDSKMVAIGTGGSGRNAQENNVAFIIKMPEVVK